MRSLLGFILVVLLAPRLANAQSAVQGPRIQFDYLIQECWPIPADETCKFAFPFKNVGDAPLVFSTIQGNTGADVAVDSPIMNIPPNSTDTIYAEFNTYGKVGLIEKAITVVSNDSLQPRTTLFYKINIIQGLGRLRFINMADNRIVKDGEFNRPLIKRQSRGFCVLKLENVEGKLLKIDVRSFNGRNQFAKAVLLTRSLSEIKSLEEGKELPQNQFLEEAVMSGKEVLYLVVLFNEWSLANVFKGAEPFIPLPIGVGGI